MLLLDKLEFVYYVKLISQFYDINNKDNRLNNKRTSSIIPENLI